jgi:glucosyl-dolichyl phosphate glucuronosyltransferase
MLSASIVIPTFNRAEFLPIALDTVGALAVPEGWQLEVLVIDNNSTDETAAVVQGRQKRFPVPLRRVTETKQGLNHARNRGMEEASGEWLIYLDDDIKVAPGWLGGLAEAVRAFKPDVVTGPVFPWFETDVPSWCTSRVLDSITSSYSRRGDQPMVLSSPGAAELPGCNFAVRRRLAREAGGFHPALDRSGDGMLAGGDFELGMRLVDHGARCVYAPRCSVEHFISRHKMSKAGLAARWRGLGVTAKAMRRIRGERMEWRQQCRMFLRMHRFRWRARRWAARSPDTAFRWELEALRLQGLLFGRVYGVVAAGAG